MNTPMRPSPRHVPTLTEVIDLPEAPLSQVDAGDAVVTDLPPVLASEAAISPMASLAAEPAVEALVEAYAAAHATPAESVDLPLSLQDAPIPRAMLVDRGAERPSFSRTAPGGLPAASAHPIPSASPTLAPEAAAPGGAALEAQISQRVMADLQRQIDGMLEYRLRETLAPILARTTEALVRELRQELSKTMKDVVARSVAQEVARQRSRG
jgi:hypothetical protein